MNCPLSALVKINPPEMQTARLLQAVVVILLTASCTASKEYTAKIFGPRQEIPQDSMVSKIRFLELEKINQQEEGWVKTDIVTKKDSAVLATKEVVVIDTTVIDAEPVARTTPNNGTRNKTTRD